MRTLFAVVLFTVAVFARADDLINADRPGIADGTATVGRGTFQIETGIDRTQTDIVFPTLLRYGITPSVEVRVESDTVTRQRGGPNEWAPLSVGAKWHFAGAPSLATIVRVTVPSGSGASKQSHVSGELQLAGDFEVGDRWSFNPNVGIAEASDGRRFTAALASLTVQFNLTERANVFVDAGTEVPEEAGGHSSVLVDAGGALIVARDTQFDAEATWRAHGKTSPALTLSAGISHRF